MQRRYNRLSYPRPIRELFPTTTMCTLTLAIGIQSGALYADEVTEQQRSRAAVTPPLYFESNIGQSDSRVKFIARGNGMTLFLTGTGVVARMAQKEGSPADVSLEFVGAGEAHTVVGIDERRGRSHHLIGSVPGRWVTGITQYSKVVYRDLYPGVDVLFYGTREGLEFDFIVEPGANPDVVALQFMDARDPSGRIPVVLDELGNVVVSAGGAGLRLKRPSVFQEIDGIKIPVASRYHVSESPGPEGMPGAAHVRVQVDGYDASRPLVIDPVLSYSGYLGGLAGFTKGSGIAVDSEGMAYVTGETFADIVPLGIRFDVGTIGNVTAFVMKLDPANDEVIYSTLLGGRNVDKSFGIAVDALGQAHITGTTASSDFPTVNPLQLEFGGGSPSLGDAFIAKLSADGSELIYSTYLGGTGDELGRGIALDPSGVVVVTGETRSADFPTERALQPGFAGGLADAFVASLTPDGSSLRYSTYLGGSDDDVGMDIAVDSSGAVYVVGETRSKDFPVARPQQLTFGGGISDAFVTKLDPRGSEIIYSSYLGGSGMDRGNGIAVDVSGNAYVVGTTDSVDFPTTNEAFQPTIGGGTGKGRDAFVAKVNVSGSALAYSTYLGGGETDEGLDIAVDSSRRAYVAGRTFSADFWTVDPVQARFGGDQDAFVTRLGAGGSTLEYSTFLGGFREDFATGLAVDRSGSIYVTGLNRSFNFPTVASHRNLLARASQGAAFVAKMTGGLTEKNDADLVVTAMQVKLKQASSGEKLVVKFSIRNIGTQTTKGPFLVSLFVSEENIWDASRDRFLASRSVPRLKSGEGLSDTFKISGIGPLEGQFAVLVLDAEGVVEERNTRNNTAARVIGK